jgi:hypothetical protein
MRRDREDMRDFGVDILNWIWHKRKVGHSMQQFWQGLNGVKSRLGDKTR